MENAVGMETTLFGGPPEIGNMLKLANGQIGFMTIFAHPLFANVADIIPAMSFAADEILTNKSVWFTRAEQEKRKDMLKKETYFSDHGSVSPRSRSPAAGNRKSLGVHHEDSYFPTSPLRYASESAGGSRDARRNSNGNVGPMKAGNATPPSESRRSSLAAVAGIVTPVGEAASRRSSGASRKSHKVHGSTSMDKRRPINNVPSGQRRLSSDAVTSPDHQSSENDDPKAAASAEQSLLKTEVIGDTDGAHDDRRDTGVSMRAGSENIPVLQQDPQPRSHQSPKRASTPTALSQFRFATSDANEHVRSYDPEQNYHAVHASARASAPATDIMHDKEKMGTGLVNIGEAQSLSNESTRTAPATCGADTGSPGTEATSVTSDDRPTSSHLGFPPDLQPQVSQDSSRSHKSRASNDFEAKLRGKTWTSSMRPSRESSKNDVKTVVLNGEEEAEGETGDGTRTLPRRRSRIRMGLSFFKNPLKRQESEET
jgi:hypothetical protein